ncbi:hypothetical protein [Dactylosporangium sp. NPDC048998]|uniref:hypothetical protein n=1 Tax=Dactylosporangium sp. NPDC048998 TaxID=3363976 RepID=UPI0037129FBA
MARAVTVNSDGASNALQAWDLFHGNPLLHGWTLSDVSFYPTELIQYGLIQLVTGVTTDQIHVAAATTWTLVVILAGWLARSVALGHGDTASWSSRPVSSAGDRTPSRSDPVDVAVAGGDQVAVRNDDPVDVHDGAALGANAPGSPPAGLPDEVHGGAPQVPGGSTAPPTGDRVTTFGGSGALVAAPGAPLGRARLRRAVAGIARSGWLPVAIVVAFLLVPAPGVGYQTLLSSPNHTGSAVPLLLAWLLLDRARHRPWMPYAIAMVLAWGALGDPLVTFVGAAPLTAVSLLRALRRRRARGVDARLALAGPASVVLSHAGLWLIERVGGFHAPRPPIRLSPLSEWSERAGTVARMAGFLFGTNRPGVQGRWLEGALQAVHLPGLVLALAALSLTVVALARGTADRVDAVLAAAILCDIGAQIVSTLPIDRLATREIAPVLPMSAVLAARLVGRRLSRPAPASDFADGRDQGEPDGPDGQERNGADQHEPNGPRWREPNGPDGQERNGADHREPSGPRQQEPIGPDQREPSGYATPTAQRPAGPVPRFARARAGATGRLRSHVVGAGPRLASAGLGLLAVMLAVQLVALVGYAPPRAEPIEGQEAADWLQRQGLRYGLGSYWVSNNITVGTSRNVTVVPTLSGAGKLIGMCWQTHTGMYDASAHDARFALLEQQRPMYGTVADVLRQFGPPVLRHDIGGYAILVYDRNLLRGFSATC